MDTVVYNSLFFTTIGGTFKKFWIPLVAVDTYVKRDLALIECQKLGGIYAVPTPAYMKFRKVHMTASRKIRSKDGWQLAPLCEILY